jgi:uncharacterized protein (DUF2141 family)
MKKIAIMIVFVLVTGYLAAQTLTIRIENADVGRGYLMIGVFNEEKTFPDTYFRGEKISVSERIMTITFTDLPKGQYAVSAYQDTNNNEKLDKNLFGIPKEKYGFSNNSDRPNYGKCLFEFYGNTTITIQLK